MYIHIGDKIIISSQNMVGIFNKKTLEKSEENNNYTATLKQNTKSVIVQHNNSILESRISPFTLLKRNEIKDGILWRKDNV
jgi:regulator of extracellular matrix RemA (YlzA/DUF370 family)